MSGLSPPWRVPCDVHAERTPATPGGIGFILPTFTQDGPLSSDPAADLASVASDAESLGADALWACDHLFWHGPCLEVMTALTVAATATEQASIGTCVLQLPLRGTADVAKQAATLQLLSRGRFVLGVGVGSHEGEYAEVGVDFHARGRILDAAITELRRSWATGSGLVRSPEDADGADRYRQLPEPSPVPVWVGGSSESALRRAAAIGDGWMPLFLTPREYASALDRLTKEVDRAERTSGSVTPAMVLFVSVDDDRDHALARGTAWMSRLYGIPAKAFDRHLVSGSAAEVADVIGAFDEAGARHVVVYVTADRPLEQFERLMAAVGAGSAPER